MAAKHEHRNIVAWRGIPGAAEKQLAAKNANMASGGIVLHQ